MEGLLFLFGNATTDVGAMRESRLSISGGFNFPILFDDFWSFQIELERGGVLFWS